MDDNEKSALDALLSLAGQSEGKEEGINPTTQPAGQTIGNQPSVQQREDLPAPVRVRSLLDPRTNMSMVRVRIPQDVQDDVHAYMNGFRIMQGEREGQPWGESSKRKIVNAILKSLDAIRNSGKAIDLQSLSAIASNNEWEKFTRPKDHKDMSGYLTYVRERGKEEGINPTTQPVGQAIGNQPSVQQREDLPGPVGVRSLLDPRTNMSKVRVRIPQDVQDDVHAYMNGLRIVRGEREGQPLEESSKRKIGNTILKSLDAIRNSGKAIDLQSLSAIASNNEWEKFTRPKDHKDMSGYLTHVSARGPGAASGQAQGSS